MRSRKAWIVLLFAVPALAVGLSLGGFLYLFQRYEASQRLAQAGEVAAYELKRLTSTYNYRLNLVREELFHIYNEQVNLSRVSDENQRSKQLFFRRRHLGAYGVLVQNSARQWVVQKYFLKDGAIRLPEVKELLEVFKTSAAAMAGSGYVVEQLSSKLFADLWEGQEGYLAGFLQKDDAGNLFALIGVFRPSYLFSFCGAFADSFGAMGVNAFVMDSQGKAVCHSQARLQGTLISRPGISTPTGPLQYETLAGVLVSAFVRKVDPGKLVLVAEVEPDPVRKGPSPYPAVVLATAVLVAGLACLGWVFARSRDDSEDLNLLRQEKIELESTVLHLQRSQAFVAHFQKNLVDLAHNEDLAKAFVRSLAVWNAPVLWFEKRGEVFELRESVHWDDSRQVAVEAPTGGVPDSIGRDPKVLATLEEQLGRRDLFAQPVVFGDSLLGLLVVAGESVDFDLLPQLAQIYAFVSQARATTRRFQESSSLVATEHAPALEGVIREN
ncbi:MAG: hypothetical protein AB1540_07930 [Bdellovibrionota bacterium]